MSIRDSLKRGFKYVAAGQLGAYAIRFGSNLLLARLLAPELFGLMSVGVAFIYAAAMLCDIGLRSAIIQEQRADDRRFRDTVWSVMTVRVLVFLGMLGAAIAGLHWGQATGHLPAGSVYSDPRLITALMLLAVAESFKFLDSIEVLYREREMQFRTLFRFEISRQIVSTTVTITWSILDPGIVALCAGSLVSNTVMLVASYLVIGRRGPRFVWAPDDYRYIVFQGRWLLVSAVLTFAMNMLDRVYLASYFDAAQMGLYSIAMVFGLVVTELVAKVGASVIFPAISERVRAGDPELWRSFYQARKNVLRLSLGCGFFFIAFGDDLIRLLYDPRYHGAGTVLQVFGVVTLLSMFSPSGDAYLAMGQAKVKSQVYLVRVLSLLVALAVLVPSAGLTGGVWALVVSYACGALMMLFFNRRLGLLRWREESRAIAALVVVGLGAAALSRI